MKQGKAKKGSLKVGETSGPGRRSKLTATAVKEILAATGGFETLAEKHKISLRYLYRLRSGERGGARSPRYDRGRRKY